MMEPGSLKDIAIIATPFLVFVLGIGVAVIGYFLKGIIADLKDTKEKTGRVERDLLEFKAKLPLMFVLKDDYIRTISVFEKKLDDVNDNLVKLIERGNGTKPHL